MRWNTGGPLLKSSRPTNKEKKDIISNIYKTKWSHKLNHVLDRRCIYWVCVYVCVCVCACVKIYFGKKEHSRWVTTFTVKFYCFQQCRNFFCKLFWAWTNFSCWILGGSESKDFRIYVSYNLYSYISQTIVNSMQSPMPLFLILVMLQLNCRSKEYLDEDIFIQGL